MVVVVVVVVAVALVLPHILTEAFNGCNFTTVDPHERSSIGTTARDKTRPNFVWNFKGAFNQ